MNIVSRIPLAPARQKLLLVGKAAEAGEKSTDTPESFFRTWKLRSLMFFPRSSVFSSLHLP
ncbi:hypothetical protein BES34_006510 [Leptospira inadai serovar Lyme]|uniref:Uncharacterized protein n=1 Tax=Leptospira inadai serovar Lyme TaxID=293084 RepID=A0ABX4YKG5_9LEPT|nr:hypothetical protein BES34_006510 [Leptospira inadai serovar Lyme]